MKTAATSRSCAPSVPLTVSVSPTAQPCSLGSELLDRDLPGAEPVERAVEHVDLDRAAQRPVVDADHVLHLAASSSPTGDAERRRTRSRPRGPTSGSATHVVDRTRRDHARRGPHDEVGVGLRLDHARDRLLRRRRDHRDRTDQRHADHERAGGVGGAARVAHHVAAGQPPDGPQQPHERPREDPDGRARHRRREHQHADEHRGRTRAEQRARRRRTPAAAPRPPARRTPSAVTAQPADRRASAATSPAWRRRRASPRRAARAPRGGRAARPRATLTTVPTSERDDDRRHVERDVPDEVHPHRAQPDAQHRDQAEPARDAERRAEQPHDRGLHEHGREHLRRGRPDGPQQRELAHPLPHRHRERVGDDERADEQRDRREDQQERRDEPELARDLRLVLGAQRVPGDDLEAAVERSGARSASTSCLDGRAVAAYTAMSMTPPSGASTSYAVCGSTSTIVAPAIGPPRSTRPTTSTSTRPARRARRRWCHRAPGRTTRAWPSPARPHRAAAGARPSTTLERRVVRDVHHARTTAPAWSARRCRPHRPARSDPRRPGIACATPSTAADLVRRASRGTARAPSPSSGPVTTSPPAASCAAHVHVGGCRRRRRSRRTCRTAWCAARTCPRRTRRRAPRRARTAGSAPGARGSRAARRVRITDPRSARRVGRRASAPGAGPRARSRTVSGVGSVSSPTTRPSARNSTRCA